MEDVEKMNETYLNRFWEIKPARICVAVRSIVEYADVEMKYVALYDCRRSISKRGTFTWPIYLL
ncbi:hypothetical protein DPV78_004635 [Talaromyces pinophilus]|nr:hypothetical protein DPV78_004635 [Talaromyces pinophilus]